MDNDNAPDVKHMLESIGLLYDVENGEMVVLHEAEFEDAEGVLNAESVDDTSRAMLVRQITDLDFIPNQEWVTMCVTSDLWAKAKGRDTLMWNMCFPEGGKDA
jgi:hypothetical protein